MSEYGSARPEASARIGWMRMGFGLAQGLMLYGLYRLWEGPHSWAAAHAPAYAAMGLVVCFVGLVPVVSLGSMRPRTLIIFALAMAAVLAGFAWWDLVRDSQGRWGGARTAPDFPVVAFSAAFLFIAHRLTGAADQARRLIAPYPAYFDTAWKTGVQLALSAAFVGVFWLLLELGAALFGLIGLKFFGKLIHHAWFWMPVAATAFAAAVHLTDVRVGIIKGIRTVILTLLAWLTPVMALITLGFLVSLPFTGLEALWKIGRSTAILLGAAGALVILINAAYQDGSDETRAGLILRVTGRVAALLLTPLILIASYGLMLRIGQHGLTPDRIIAAACLLVGACYAAGYGVGAVLPGAWMKPLERTNIVTAFVILGIILALFSPVADATRLSVDDQVSRLKSGRVSPEKFDYKFLRWQAGDYGRETLKRLAATKTGANAAVIAQHAGEALRLENRYEDIPVPAADLATDITVYPKGQKLPDSFVKQVWPSGEQPCRRAEGGCEAVLLDVDGDGKAEILVRTGHSGSGLIVYGQDKAGAWSRLAHLSPYCNLSEDALSKGQVRTLPARFQDLEIEGHRFHVEPNRSRCDEPETGAAGVRR
jgi:hypothetical protein